MKKNFFNMSIVAVSLYIFYIYVKTIGVYSNLEIKEVLILQVISDATADFWVEEGIYAGKADYANEMAMGELAACLDESYFEENHVSYENYRSSIHDEIEEKFRYYFPCLKTWTWHFTGWQGKDRMMTFEGSDDELSEEGYQYTAQFILHPDFSIEVLEDTIEVEAEKSLCIYTVRNADDADADYAYHGGRICEYRAVYYDAERDLSFDAVIPLFSIKDTDKWNEMNCNIIEGLEKWLGKETDYLQGQISLDYKIKTLNNNLYSILLEGESENDHGRKDVMIGMTFSMSTGNILPKTVFCKDEPIENFYDFYIAGGNIYSIAGRYGFRKSAYDGWVRFHSYSIEKRERHVYSDDGRWIGNCYYELLQVGGCTEHPAEETDKVNEKLEREMGRFLSGVAQEFETIVLEWDTKGEHESETDLKTSEGIQKYQCYVESEVSYNNNGYIGVVYHYLVDLGEIYESGEASAVYDVESGKTITYQHWQSELLENIRAQAGQPEEAYRDVYEEYDYVLREYERACLDDTYTRPEWETVCDLAAAYIDNPYRTYVFGYCIVDLADDGTPELIIGVKEREEEEYVVFVIYTYEGGTLNIAHERDFYQIGVYQGGIIEAVGGYGSTGFYVYSRIQKNAVIEWLGQLVVEGGMPEEYDADSQIRFYFEKGDEKRELTVNEFWDMKNQYTEVPVELEWKELTGFWR